MINAKKFIRNAALIVGCMAFLTSCEPEEPEPPGGNNNENITGTWSCAETSQEYGTSNYEVIISNSPSSSSQVRIQNFYQLKGAFVNVSVSGSSLTIPKQTVQSIEFAGTGTIVNSNRINLSYTADDGGGVIDQVTAGLSN
ncbi:MAG: hypothetical protein H0X62_06975 [Bacteroidetes bacterium]|nr:hypothetical protein [Bacteroidota bacterium]